MISILNIKIPLNKNFKSSLCHIYGIGFHRALKLTSLFGLHANTRIEFINNINILKLSTLIEKNFSIDFELRYKLTMNIEALQKIKTFRGYRHHMALPTRGQRTHTNASTARKLLISAKKKNKIILRDRERNRGPKRKIKK